MAKIEIDTKKCLEIARHIKIFGGVPPDKEDLMLYSFPAEIAANGWWAMVAINQQTTPVVGKPLKGWINGKELHGWDYLLQKAIVEASNNKEMFTREWLLQMTPEIVRNLYRDEKEGDTLNQIKVRADLWRGLGTFLKHRRWHSINEAYFASDGYIYRSDGQGLAHILFGACAYQDPVQKKIFYLLAIMRNRGFWDYKDPINLSSPVNYHEQRLHLRLGTVRITDAAFEKKIRARENILNEEDIEIRFTVRRAIEFLAQLLDVSPPMMHYYLWNHGRNCCSRDNPHCFSCGETCQLPERYRNRAQSPLIEAHCVFTGACHSAGLAVKEMFIEPRLDDTIWQ